MHIRTDVIVNLIAQQPKSTFLPSVSIPYLQKFSLEVDQFDPKSANDIKFTFFHSVVKCQSWALTNFRD